MFDLLALRPADVVTHFYIWQLVTYSFLHGGIGHILFNMLALWMFGTEFERLWGTRRFLRFYFFCARGRGAVRDRWKLFVRKSGRGHHRIVRRDLRHSAGLRRHVAGSPDAVLFPDSASR